MKSTLTKDAMRGVIGFTGGAFAAVAMSAWWLITTSAHTEAAAPRGATPLALMGLLLSGAIGAVAVTWGAAAKRDVVRAAFFFGAGLTIAFSIAFIAAAVGFDHKTMRADYAWTIVGYATGYAIGGGIGGSALGSRYATLAALSFGIGGALGGTLLAVSSNHFSAGRFVEVVAIFVPYAVGGALFGAFAGRRRSAT